MRLLISERPQRRHLRQAGDPGILSKNVLRTLGSDNENIDGHAAIFFESLEASRLPCQIKPAQRRVKKDSPAIRFQSRS